MEVCSPIGRRVSLVDGVVTIVSERFKTQACEAYVKANEEASLEAQNAGAAKRESNPKLNTVNNIVRRVKPLLQRPATQILNYLWDFCRARVTLSSDDTFTVDKNTKRGNLSRVLNNILVGSKSSADEAANNRNVEVILPGERELVNVLSRNAPMPILNLIKRCKFSRVRHNSPPPPKKKRKIVPNEPSIPPTDENDVPWYSLN